MIDTRTRRPLRVQTSAGAGAFIMLRLDQVARVSPLLDANEVKYWIDDEAISIDGRPAVTVINLSRNQDPEFVQRLLDSLD
jgi:hypothetical protein